MAMAAATAIIMTTLARQQPEIAARRWQWQRGVGSFHVELTMRDT